MRSWPPWVKVTTTWVPFSTASLAAARRSRPPVRRSMTSRSPVSSFWVSSSPRRSPPATLAPSSRPTNCFFGQSGDRASTRDVDGLHPLADHLAIELAADRLDFGQLRHPGPLTGFSEPRRADRPAPTASESSASLAATCSACFFERPEPAPEQPTAHHRGRGEGLVVLGADLGHVVADLGVQVAAGQLLEPALGVRARRVPRPARPADRGRGRARRSGPAPSRRRGRWRRSRLPARRRGSRPSHGRRSRPRPCRGGARRRAAARWPSRRARSSARARSGPATASPRPGRGTA